MDPVVFGGLGGEVAEDLRHLFRVGSGGEGPGPGRRFILDAATISMALVIFAVFSTLRILLRISLVLGKTFARRG